MNFDDELMMSKWKKIYYRLANQTGKIRISEGVYLTMTA